MFAFHTAFSLGMIALSSGTALYIWADRNENAGANFAKVIGIIVIIFSITSTLCTVYYGIKYWHEGYFENPASMMNNSAISGSSMQKVNNQ